MPPTLLSDVVALKSLTTSNKKPRSKIDRQGGDYGTFTHFSPVSHFYTPWKRQKTFGFLTFSGGIEMWGWAKIGEELQG